MQRQAPDEHRPGLPRAGATGEAVPAGGGGAGAPGEGADGGRAPEEGDRGRGLLLIVEQEVFHPMKKDKCNKRTVSETENINISTIEFPVRAHPSLSYMFKKRVSSLRLSSLQHFGQLYRTGVPVRH